MSGDEIPALRLRNATPAELDKDGDYILYWMIAYRRPGWNFALQRAVHWARELRKPLVIFEPLRCGYRWASDRFHAFVVEGMAVNARRLSDRPVLYYPYLETKAGEGKGLLEALAERACVVVSDDYPCFFLPRMVSAVADRMPVRFELVDSNGLLPLRQARKVYSRAFDFRRFVHEQLHDHLEPFPKKDPLARLRLPTLDKLPDKITRRWPPANLKKITKSPQTLDAFLKDLPIDHEVGRCPTRGGCDAAEERMEQFFDDGYDRYAEQRNHPDAEAASRLSPYLHFGHLAAHQVFGQVVRLEAWNPTKVDSKAKGKNEGWWNMSPNGESFLDELITWRELGFNMCWQREDYDQYESLPDWARTTLAEHADDPREHHYPLEKLAAAETDDEIWNAAQRELVREGRIHNYLRMLWGKKILQWTADPREALEVLLELNNRYALDGRDPNSYSGIFWVLGRYDRAWGPERPIFGKIRYMTSQSTRRKLKLDKYLEQYAD